MVSLTSRLGLHKLNPNTDLWDLFEADYPADLQKIDDKAMLRIVDMVNNNVLIGNSTGDAVDSSVALDSIMTKVPAMVAGDVLVGNSDGEAIDGGVLLSSITALLTSAMQKVASMVADNFLAADANGAPYDSGVSIGAFYDAASNITTYSNVSGAVTSVGQVMVLEFPKSKALTLDNGTLHTTINGEMILRGY